MAYRVKLRDKLAEAICNFAMDVIASKEYAQYVWIICSMGADQFHQDFEKLEDEPDPKAGTSPGGPAGYG